MARLLSPWTYASKALKLLVGKQQVQKGCSQVASFPAVGAATTFKWTAGFAWIRVGREMLAHANKALLLRPRKRAVALRLFTAALLAAVGVAQLSSAWHEASVRHVQCAEHGEAIDVGVVASVASPARDRAASGGMEGADSAETSSHDHCAVVLAFRASARAKPVRLATRFEPPPVVVRPASEPAQRPGRAVVLASAPKTSPPSV